MTPDRKEGDSLVWARETRAPKRSWKKMSASEEKSLIGMYRSGVPRRKIAERLHKSNHAIARRIRILISKGKLDYRSPNMYRTPKTPENRARCIRNMSNPWTQEEDRIILDAMQGKKAFSAEDLKDLEERTGRTARAIKTRLNVLGIFLKQVACWTEEDDGLLRRAYQEGIPVKEICRTLKRSRDSVLHRASRLGLTHPNRSGKKEML